MGFAPYVIDGYAIDMFCAQDWIRTIADDFE
jgi:hypothetical protein